MDTNTFKTALKVVDPEGTYSPYAAAKLAAEILGRPMRPQMVYNYCQKGYIVATKGEGGWEITGESLRAWLTRFAIRNVLDIQI